MKLTARLALLSLAVLVVAGGVATGALGFDEPVGNFRFKVEIAGLEECPVAFVEGIVAETDVIAYRAGTDRRTRKIPGRHAYGNLVIRRGVTSDTSWWTWRKEVIDGADARRDVRIRVIDPQGDPVMSIEVADAWPAAYRVAPLDANDGVVLLEELELAVEAIERDG